MYVVTTIIAPIPYVMFDTKGACELYTYLKKKSAFFCEAKVACAAVSMKRPPTVIYCKIITYTSTSYPRVKNNIYRRTASIFRLFFLKCNSSLYIQNNILSIRDIHCFVYMRLSLSMQHHSNFVVLCEIIKCIKYINMKYYVRFLAQRKRT